MKKYKSKIQISITDIIIELTSNSIMIDKNTVPPIVGLDCVKKQIVKRPDGKVIHRESKTFFITYRKRMIFIYAPKKKILEANMLYYLAELLAERCRAEGGGFIIHSSAFYLPQLDAGVLILGEKGSGKTSLLIRVCKELDAKLIANDQAIILHKNELFIENGSKTIKIRKTAILQEDFIESNKLFSSNHIPNWEHKIDFPPEQLGIEVCDKPVKLTHIFKIMLDRTLESSYVINCANNIQTILFLAEKASRHISGIASPILTNKLKILGFPPNLDNERTKMKRATMLNIMLYDIGITEIHAQNITSAYDCLKRRIYDCDRHSNIQ